MTKLVLYIARRFPIRGSKNVSNKGVLRLFGATLAELRREVRTYIDADAFSYGEIKSIRMFDWEDMERDALAAKPLREWASLDSLMGEP